jgi:ankyrin repeat protein
MESRILVKPIVVVAILLAGAIDVEAQDLPLAGAVRRGDAVAARALVTRRIGVNTPEADGTTPLHIAVQRNDLETVTLLLQAGATAHAATRYGVTPLYLASTNGNAAVIEALLAAGAPANTALPEGETALMTAARNGNIGAVRALLRRGADPNARENWKGQTALMWAAAHNNAGAVTALLEGGADLRAQTKSGGFTALLFAIRAGHIEAARALLDAGASVHDGLPNRFSPIILALFSAHYEMAGLLLERGADPNSSAQGWTPLHQIVWSRRPSTGFNLPGAVQTGNLDSLDLVRKLLQRGADINARQTEEPKDGNRTLLRRIGATPFLLAAKSVDLPLMRLLLENGADPTLTTEDGTNALMVAAGVGIWAAGDSPGSEEEAMEAVKLTHAVGGGTPADIDKNGETALHGAIYRAGSIAIAKFLIDRGAKLDVVNAKGWTPLTVADGVEYNPNVLKRYPDTAEFLREAMRAQGLRVPEPSEAFNVLGKRPGR